MLVRRLPPRWSSPGLAPFLGRPGQCGYSFTTPAGGRLATAYDLACNGPLAGRIFNGIGSRTWNPPAPDVTTKPPWSPFTSFMNYISSKKKDNSLIRNQQELYLITN
ncbi:hypothetical protein AVEN_188774-1 [Araneus ventricosus]|uniref:Uncharacterized protein n=1 Tax=Araneus ventricosus TaxID=182803 RepID=A0A4Y2BFG5_ARAVE|nr:hypothetical protein AVEN_215529-1 [Araneus ventricosus]GBO23336.1 hypothetical protein AVEN_188774-1 [Araneus ventricosus]